jgi:hypothetical protein
VVVVSEQHCQGGSSLWTGRPRFDSWHDFFSRYVIAVMFLLMLLRLFIIISSSSSSSSNSSSSSSSPLSDLNQFHLLIGNRPDASSTFAASTLAIRWQSCCNLTPEI